ncbi:MAG: LysR substrate-binding domain-containing protein [Mycobacterium sp.]
MKLQQLEYVLEIVRQGFHISAAARALHTSQPGVSRQLQLLEAELGFPLFARTRNHIEGLTEAGTVVVDTAKRILADVDSIGSLKHDLLASDRGTLTIATTHTQAKYVLPPVIGPFIAEYPDVQIVLKQGDPVGICQMVDEGLADLALGTESLTTFPSLVRLQCFTLDRVVVAPVGHPLLDCGTLTLEEVARYPIITYDNRFSGHWKVRAAFESAGLEPKVVLSAIDADICKTYVAMGLGIGILTAVTFDAERDRGLRVMPADHLFDSSAVYINLRASTYLRAYLLDFIGRLAPSLTPDVIRDSFQGRHGILRRDALSP